MATVSAARTTTRTPRTANPFVPPPPAPKVETVEKVSEVQADHAILANLLLAKIADGSLKDIRLVVSQAHDDGKVTLSLKVSLQLPLEIKLS